jgi:hypothetical protein
MLGVNSQKIDASLFYSDRIYLKFVVFFIPFRQS